MTKFEGKVALVTGAASGVGRATSRQMVAQGAKVFGIDINNEGLGLVADELGADFKPAVCDISNREASQACLLYTSPSPRDLSTSRMPSSA